MQVFKENVSRSKITIMSEIPSVITYNEGKPATMTMSNRKICHAGCLGCTNPPCMNFHNAEIDCQYIDNFPYDRNTDVCPVDALSWSHTDERPCIDTEKCIKCGLCISRCPVGAIYYDTTIQINDTYDEDFQKELEMSRDAAHEQYTQIKQLQTIGKTGVFINESDDLLFEIYKKLEYCGSNYHNLIVRNLLIGLGNICSMRRIGDVYTRMDAIYSSASNSFGAVEVEFGRDTLDASRGILEDIAVLNTRYGVAKNKNMALVVCLQLPNARQGYWQVVRDIMKVESIKINTITIGALMALLWNCKTLDLGLNPFYVDYDNMNIRNLTERVIGRNLNVTEKFGGIFEPLK